MLLSRCHLKFSFVRIAYHLARQLPAEFFARTFLLPLLTLQDDEVANVRLALARLLSQVIHPGARICHFGLGTFYTVFSLFWGSKR